MTPPVPTWPVIEHIRDILTDDAGAIEEEYNYLVYDFGDDVIARTYLDTADRVAVMRVGTVPDAVLTYLKARFWQIDQVGAQGYETIWNA